MMNEEQMKQHVHNLEETSYNEDSHDLACRCADSLTIITQLQQRIVELEAEMSATTRKALDAAIAACDTVDIVGADECIEAIRALAPLQSIDAEPATATDNFEELLGDYWDIAHMEGAEGVSRSDEANDLLHRLRVCFANRPALIPLEAERSAWAKYAALASADAEKRNDELVKALNDVRPLIWQRMGAEQIRERLQSILFRIPKECWGDEGASAAIQAAQDKWRDAVLAECMKVESCYVEADPEQTLNNLINWYAQNENLHRHDQRRVQFAKDSFRDPEVTLKMTIEQADALAALLDLSIRQCICQFTELVYWARCGLIKHAEGRELTVDELDLLDDVLVGIGRIFGVAPNASLGIGSPHVSKIAHRGWELNKVLAKALAKFRDPNPQGIRGVAYEGLIVRYTDDPAPIAEVLNKEAR